MVGLLQMSQRKDTGITINPWPKTVDYDKLTAALERLIFFNLTILVNYFYIL